MDNISERPNFNDEQIETELNKVVLLDQILADNGALTLNQLNDMVHRTDKVMTITFPQVKFRYWIIECWTFRSKTF